MNVIGIVAEWNPYHNGHRLLTQHIRTRIPDAVILAVMSGPFTQRGEPALLDKWCRTEIALAEGIDVVLELPQTFATASLEGFARGAVQTLLASGALTALAFGSESGDEAALRKGAALLKQPTPAFKTHFQAYREAGAPYARAHQQALQDCGCTVGLDKESPNDRLALHYIRHLPAGFPLIAMPREGRHDAEPAPGATVASASFVRQYIRAGRSIHALVPSTTAKGLQEVSVMGWEWPDMALLYTTLRQLMAGLGPDGLAARLAIHDGWHRRCYRAMQESDGWQDFLARAQTRHYSRARIHRLMLQLLAPTPDASTAVPYYLRILGMSSQGRLLLKNMRRHAALPLVQNLGRDAAQLPPAARTLLGADVARQNLAACLQTAPALNKWNADYQTPPVCSDHTAGNPMPEPE